MKISEYRDLQNIITSLYETTKYKDYSPKEKEGAKKFALALKSKLKDIYNKEDLENE